MTAIQFIHYTPEQLQSCIVAGIQTALDGFLKQVPKSPSEEILTRQEVADLLKISLSTIHNWCKKGKLKPHGIGNRVYFKRSEIEENLKRIS